MTCDVYASEARADVWVLVPAGAATTAVAAAAGLGELRPVRIDAELEEVLPDGASPAAAQQLSTRGWIITTDVRDR